MAKSDKQDSSPIQPRRRNLLPVLAIATLTGAAGVAVVTATSLADYAQSRLSRQVAQALAGDGFDWVSVSANGTQVHISGTAPDEVTRYRALLGAETAITVGRVIDDMQVAAASTALPPDFEVELLRNDQGTSIIGLVPAGLDRASVVAGLQRGTPPGQVSDLLETADYPVPAHWDEAFSFGLRAAQLATRAKISIRPGQVTVQAMTDDQPAREALIQALQRNLPAHVTLNTDITAPRPIIAPFALRLTRDDVGTRFDSCAADDDRALADILAAGTKAGVTVPPDCPLGLGAPAPQWGQAAVAVIGALASLDRGAVTMLDAGVALTAPATVDAADFDAVAAQLAAALPAPFTLTAKRDADPDDEVPATEFSARLTDQGQVVLAGIVSDMRMRDAVESFARSRIGPVESDLQLDPALPGGWTLRTIAALEAMADLQRGTVWVGPDLIRITGISGDQGAADVAAMRLAERLGAGEGYEMQIGYDRRLDPLLGLPSGAICVDQLNTIMRESLIGFEPNRSVIAGDPEPTLALLSDAMAECGDFRIELGGHTDSQGSQSFNEELSEKRAQALLKAMAAHGIKTGLLNARGYGASQPIADNETDAGREANRRIEFRLLSEDPVQLQPPSPAPVIKGVTQAAPVPASRPAAAETAAPEAVVMSAPDSQIAQVGDAPDIVGSAGHGDAGAALVQMVATILVNDLAVSPELAIDIADDLEDPVAEVQAALTQAATAVARIVFSAPAGDAAIHAATTVAPTAVGEGAVPILTPSPETPRPQPRPLSQPRP